jgi:SAM-dependent methyltransferase
MLDATPSKRIDIPTRETLDFLSNHLAIGSAILEVGCGDGEVALELSRKGYRVVGLDSEPQRVAKAQKSGVNAMVASWPEFDSSPVDAIAFTRSLHHINPLDGAVERARELIRPDGLLLIEDFAFGETDDRTVRWFHEILRSDQGTSHVIPVEGQFATKLLSAEEPMKAWHENHDQALHPISALVSAISKRFVIRETNSVPYLYRYLIPVLPETTTAAAFLEEVLHEEARLGEKGEILLMGRRIVATPK